jgi:triosephosphate isomerase
LNISNPYQKIRPFGLSEKWPGKQRIVGAGLKMYLNYQETVQWLSGLRTRISELGSVGVFVLPTFPALGEARAALYGSTIQYGAQNTHWEESGPFTGEVSPTILHELGCTIVEIGHAERRILFSETDEQIKRKTEAVLRHGMVPLICIGENEHQPIQLTINEVIHQLRAALNFSIPDSTNDEDPCFSDSIIIAYEPVWAIGAEVGASVSYLTPIVAAIRKEVTDLWFGKSAILYGGSVKADTAMGLFNSCIDGLFIGRAALDLDQFIKIIQEVNSFKDS